MADAPPEANAEVPHTIRTSLEFMSLKEVKFTGRVFFRVHSLEELGVGEYRTFPTCDVPRTTREEVALQPAIHSFECSALRADLKLAVERATLRIDLIVVDRNAAERVVAQALVPLAPLGQSPTVRTTTSYVRVHDAFHRLEEADARRGKLAELRLKVYLEDLGPRAESAPVPAPPPCAPAGDELEELQMRVVAELDQWRQAQEMKFLLELKNREFEAVSKAIEETRRRDVEKEKVCRNYEAAVAAFEARLRDKLGELQRREHKLALFEGEMRAKITEAAAEVSAKNEEMRRMRAEFDEERKKWRKTRAASDARAEDVQQLLRQKEGEVEKARREAERGPVAALRAALQQKEAESTALRLDLDRATELQSEYKDLRQRLQDTAAHLRVENDALKLKVERQAAAEAKFRLTEMLVPEMHDAFAEARKDLKQLAEGRRVLPVAPPGVALTHSLGGLWAERQRLLDLGLSTDDIVIAEIDAQLAEGSRGPSP